MVGEKQPAGYDSGLSQQRAIYQYPTRFRQ